ncbi:hypothetical protein [Haloferula sp. BvORR071]|uniref:hypothetical protein n=1 Tax=Haloferula sp. BvORR071 TaxID=1396141 RepID=UPI0005583D4B|nr:hypothetical protein [Haloferula sp. BvORR071]
MSFADSIKPFLFLAVGLAVGGVGVMMFRDSLPGGQGSPEQRVSELEAQLKKAENRAVAAEASVKRSGSRSLTQGARDLIDDAKAGRPISPDDILHALQPSISIVSPIMDRMRVRQEKRMIDGQIGEIVRRYNLDAEGEEKLRKFFDKKIEADAERFSSLVSSPGATMPDIMRETQSKRWDDGLDQFVKDSQILKGDDLIKFEDERIAEKSQRVQSEADMRVSRIDNIVKLDAKQRDQMFGVMARNSRDYDPAMQIDGATGDIGALPGGSREQAMQSILREDQRQAWEAEKQRRRDDAQKEMSEIGLTMPSSWDPFEDY